MGCKSAFLDYTCCDLVVKLKECKKHEDLATPEPSPAMPPPTAAEEPQSSDPLEGSSMPRHLLASSMTLQVKSHQLLPILLDSIPGETSPGECGMHLDLTSAYDCKSLCLCHWPLPNPFSPLFC